MDPPHNPLRGPNPQWDGHPRTGKCVQTLLEHTYLRATCSTSRRAYVGPNFNCFFGPARVRKGYPEKTPPCGGLPRGFPIYFTLKHHPAKRKLTSNWHKKGPFREPCETGVSKHVNAQMRQSCRFFGVRLFRLGLNFSAAKNKKKHFAAALSEEDQAIFARICSKRLP